MRNRANQPRHKFIGTSAMASFVSHRTVAYGEVVKNENPMSLKRIHCTEAR